MSQGFVGIKLYGRHEPCLDFDRAGQLIMEHQITSAITIINLSDYPKGIYLIKSKPLEGLPISKIFIGHAKY